MMKNQMEFRCGRCRRLLGKGRIVDMTIKCPRCGAYNRLRAVSSRLEPREGLNEDMKP